MKKFLKNAISSWRRVSLPKNNKIFDFLFLGSRRSRERSTRILIPRKNPHRIFNTPAVFVHSSTSYLIVFQKLLTRVLKRLKEASWQQWVATALSVIMVLNTGLLSAVAHAETFEVSLNDFSSASPEEGQEFPLVAILVESELYADGQVSSALESYGEQVRDRHGMASVILPTEGKSASRIEEALQHLYAEGMEVSGGLGKLVGVLIVGDVPLPIVHDGMERFPTVFPYVDREDPALVFDPEQQIYVRSSSAQRPQAELWHGLIRPPGEQTSERIQHLVSYFAKLEAFYDQDPQYSIFRDAVAFQHYPWEASAFNLDRYRGYLKKMASLDRLMNYRYSSEWLQELNGEATDRFEDLVNKTFDGAPVAVQKPSNSQFNASIGFDSQAARNQSRQSRQQLARQGGLNSSQVDEIENIGIPDIFTPGPIRNLLSDYVGVVDRNISGTTALADVLGRRQYFETLPMTITKMDKYSAGVVHQTALQLEVYVFAEVEKLAEDFDLIRKYSVLDSSLGKIEVQEVERYSYGFPIQSITHAEGCSLERGSEYVADDGEVGRAVTANRKDNPMTAQDIAGVSGRTAREQIRERYKPFGSCSYLVKDNCQPGKATQPLLDFGATVLFSGENSYQRCYEGNGPDVLEHVEKAFFHSIPSVINHVQPTGEVIQAILEGKGKVVPQDVLRHVSYYDGGLDPTNPERVQRVFYPNLFELEGKNDAALLVDLEVKLKALEQTLQQARVEAHFERFGRYLFYTLPSSPRADFWNFEQDPTFADRYQRYVGALITTLRPLFDPGQQLEDWQVLEQYLTADSLPDDLETQLQTMLVQMIPNLFARENLVLECRYTIGLLSIRRVCDNQVAHYTHDIVQTPRAFYQSQGVSVEIAFLHNADKDLRGVELPQEPSQEEKDQLFGGHPVSRLSKEFQPVRLGQADELTVQLPPVRQDLIRALDWLNLSITEKHRKGLSILLQDKAMSYLVLNGDADQIDFHLSSLKGQFAPEETGGVGEGVLEEVEERLNALYDKQEQDRKARALKARESGGSPSACGESVSLLKWPKALSCWVDELESWQLVPGKAQESEADEALVEDSASTDPELVLDKTALVLGDRALARVRVSADQELSWESEGVVRVVPGQHGEASVLSDSVGTGTVRVRIGEGDQEKVLSQAVQVLGYQVVVKPVTVADLQIGTDEELEFEVELRTDEGNLVQVSEVLNVKVDDVKRKTVRIENGKGIFSLSAGEKAGVLEVQVGSDRVPSGVTLVNVLAGDPHTLRWRDQDLVIGLDKKIQSVLEVSDAFGNPYRGEGLPVELQWTGVKVNGKDPGSGTFYLVAGELPLDVTLIEGSNSAQMVVKGVKGFPDLQTPPVLSYSTRDNYRVQWTQEPQSVKVGEDLRVGVQVQGAGSPLSLHHEVFQLQVESGGDLRTFDLVMDGPSAFVSVPMVQAGETRLLIENENFGVLSHTVSVVSDEATAVSLLDASYRDAVVTVQAVGVDQYGNRASLDQRLARLKIIADGAQVLEEKTVVIEGNVFELQEALSVPSDRVRVEISVEGLSGVASADLSLESVLEVDQLRQLPWDTPYLVLAGGAFGDYRSQDSVAQAMLYGDQSKLLALTTEITPHRGLSRQALLHPSGKVTLGTEMSMQVVWDNLKPVVVLSDPQVEVGRLFYELSGLSFEVVQSPLGDFRWTKQEGRGKVLLVPDQARYESRSDQAGDLVSEQGKKLLTIVDSQVAILEEGIETNVIDGGRDVLILEFSLGGSVLARLFVDVDTPAIAQDRVDRLRWAWSGAAEDLYQAELFYAGESTADETGLVLLKKGPLVDYDISADVSGLEDVRENNEQGFGGRDKSLLSALAQNPVGSAMQYQGFGMVNLGNPLFSLEQVQQKGDGGRTIPLFDNPAEDFTVGQLVFRPDRGQISHVLHLDVEGDGEMDLLPVVRTGSHTRVHYLEGQGEGARWGKVSELLDLGPSVDQVETVGNSILVLTEEGQLSLEENQEGKFVRRLIDVSEVGENTRVTFVAVSDADADGKDDLAFFTGRSELWVFYGSLDAGKLVFGAQDQDRKRLKSFSVSVADPANYLSSAWLHGSDTPNFRLNCREANFQCQSRYFKGLRLPGSASAPAPAADLATLEQQADSVGFSSQAQVTRQQDYLVRYDQLDGYRGVLGLSLDSHQQGSRLSLGDQMDFTLTIRPRKSDDAFVLRYDMGQAFQLAGAVECDGCDSRLRLVNRKDALWSLEGAVSRGQAIELKFSVENVQMPDFSIQVLNTNDDGFADFGANVVGNPEAKILLFQSAGPRDYDPRGYGKTPLPEPPVAPGSFALPGALSDLFKGIGTQGVSNSDLKRGLLNESQQIEASSNLLMEQAFDDGNQNGYIDGFEEVPSVPFQVLPVPDDPASGSGLQSFLEFFLPTAKANLQQAAIDVRAVEADVQKVVNMLKCSRGCLPLPINFAFLAPGVINIFGTPSGFDPGFPVFAAGIPSLIPVWPPSPYQASTFRLYVSPTLTLGLGIALCSGPWLAGQCMVFSVPVDAGSEQICDKAKQGLKAVLQGIYGVVGTINAFTTDVANEINRSGRGIITASPRPRTSDDIESLYEVNLGTGDPIAQTAVQADLKINLPPVPKLLVEWWDRQWEEIINSLTDLPDITVRLPDFRGAFGDEAYWDRVGEQYDKVSGEYFFNLQGIYDLINSFPVISLQPDVVEIQIPWIEPGLLRKMEQSLYRFLFQFARELLEFLKSFNLPCDIGLHRVGLIQDIEQRMTTGTSEEKRREIAALLNQIDETEGDLQAAERALDEFSRAKGITLDPAARQVYFDERQRRLEEVQRLGTQLDERSQALEDLEQPEQLADVLPAIRDVLTLVSESWTKSGDEVDQVRDQHPGQAESARAVGVCLAQKFSVNVVADVDEFISSMEENLKAIQVWKQFPRQLARYLNALEYYMQQVVDMLDQLTSIVVKWWSEFQRRLDTWLDVIFYYQEFVALIQLIIDILKGYSASCGLCTTDRLTLKDLIMKLLFGVVPTLPVIDFPTWPDIRIDFSEVQLGIDVTVPVFDVKTVDFQWPAEIPQVKFPRFPDFDFSAGFDFSVKLPELPLQIPSPPDLPPLPALPTFPEINLPNLPPAPEVPQVLEELLPIMDIIRTILNIWCLINKARIPISETLLKAQIENLTNRSLNLILPIDLQLQLNILPPDLLSDLVPFDLIDVKSSFRAQVDFDAASQLRQQIDQNYHQPMNLFLQQVDVWFEQLRNSFQQGLGELQSPFNEAINDFQYPEYSASVPPALDYDRIRSSLMAQRDAEKEQLSEAFEGRRSRIVQQHQGIKQGLQEFAVALRQLKREDPVDTLRSLAQLQSDHVLVSATPSLLASQVSLEKRRALLDPKNFVERQVAFVDKPQLLAALDTTRTELDQVQESLIGEPDLGASELGGVMLFENDQARRIQDYPLNNPAIAVWEDEVFLAYEGALYLKSQDGRVMRPAAYTGRVMTASFDDFQRTKVHQLRAESVSNAQATAGNATLRWSWDAPGVDKVELTIWDSISGAQRLSLDHQRYYLNRVVAESDSFFVSLTPGLTLQEGQLLQAQQEVRLAFADDYLVIPAGMTFEIPSLLARELRVSGAGVVQLQNESGQEWVIDLRQDSELDVNGLLSVEVTEPGSAVVPEVKRQRFVSSLSGTVRGAVRERVEVFKDEFLPEGSFYALQAVQLRDTQQNDEVYALNPGVLFEVSRADRWQLVRGKGEVVVSDQLVLRDAKEGMVLMDGELLEGSYRVDDLGAELDVLPQQQVVWFEIREDRFEITLPIGYYYGRIREQEGLRGYSHIVLGAAQQRHEQVALLGGVEIVEVPLYAPFQVDARDFVIGDLPDDGFRWRFESESETVSGRVFFHDGFDRAQEKTLELFVRSGEDQVLIKPFLIRVVLPDLTIDEDLFLQSRVLRVQTDPEIGQVPIGIVGSRAGVQDWLLSSPQKGSAQGQRYLSDANGVVELPALEALEGLNIVIDDGRSVARLYQNGRVVLNEDYQQSCRNEHLLDDDGFIKFRVFCDDNGRSVHKFDVRMVPDRDTDVSAVERFSPFDAGVSVRTLQGSLEMVSLPVNAEFAPGGVQIRVEDGEVLMVVTAEGQIESLDTPLTIKEKAFDTPTDPLIWQVLDAGTPLVELQIRGPGQNTQIVDPVSRPLLPGDADQDGLLDRWESAYQVNDPEADDDGDGLKNSLEFQLGTDPTEADTDGDGHSDGDEYRQDGNPLDALNILSITKAPVAFPDVLVSSPYAEAISDLARLGFIQGYQDGTFRPDQSVTRAEAIKILMSVIRCENCENPSEATRDQLRPDGKDFGAFMQFHEGQFEDGSDADPLKVYAFEEDQLTERLSRIRTYFDVEKEDWFYYCVEIATDLGLIHGYRGFENGENALGNFIPTRGVNVAELMKMVIEAMGDSGIQSDRVYGPADAWWNDSQNNYIARAEQLELLVSATDYLNPRRDATRAEVAYAAWRVLQGHALDQDEDGIDNQSDQCPCQAENFGDLEEADGCPEIPEVPVYQPRNLSRLFAGIEITQFVGCRCLHLVPADLFLGSLFYAVITGTGSDDNKVYVKSNEVGK